MRFDTDQIDRDRGSAAGGNDQTELPKTCGKAAEMVLTRWLSVGSCAASKSELAATTAPGRTLPNQPSLSGLPFHSLKSGAGCRPSPSPDLAPGSGGLGSAAATFAVGLKLVSSVCPEFAGGYREEVLADEP